MQLHLREKLKEYKYIKIHCMNRKQLLNLIDVVQDEELELHYWMPGNFQISQEEYFDNIRTVILGTSDYEPYVEENQKSVLTLRRNTHSVDLTISTTPEKYRHPHNDPVLSLDITAIFREELFEELGIF